MKSNDYHVMMQTILPLCMRHLMAKGYKMAIIRLSHVFKQLCAKIVDLTIMGELKKDVAITLVLLEWEFLPSFFDIMTHLFNSFGGGVGIMWFNPHTMDVLG
jgi:hypothetical protein